MTLKIGPFVEIDDRINDVAKAKAFNGNVKETRKILQYCISLEERIIQLEKSNKT